MGIGMIRHLEFDRDFVGHQFPGDVMPLAPTFRLSTYLALGLACLCLGYAESDVYPEVGVFAVVAVVALAVIYRLESRVELLSIPDANKLGAGIALVSAAWAGFRVLREVRQPEFGPGAWPVLLVALTGPILISLMPAKLLRREKHVGDWWVLHGEGVAAVGLAGAMADDPITFALAAAYAVCAVWSLGLFFLARSTGVVAAIPHKEPPADLLAGTPLAPAVVVAPPTGRNPFARWPAWVLVGVAVAVPLFLLTPRSPASRSDADHGRVEIGYAADQMVDLTRTGNLRTNPEPAFEVVATHEDGRPVAAINVEQRWRGATLGKYENGTWSRGDFRPPMPRHPARAAGRWAPPRLGPDRYKLAFEIPAKLPATFLADPVVWAPGEPPPVVTVEGENLHPWYPLAGGAGGFANLAGGQGGRSVRYIQYTRPLADPDLGVGFRASERASNLEGLHGLMQNPVPRVKEYADQLLVRLVAEGRLPAEADPRSGSGRRLVRLLPPQEYHEAIARAFCDHLSGPAGLTYSTNLKRQNKKVDPVEDFLFNSRSGHCERFATAMVLMLRSQGIPAALVLGFKGCDPAGGGRFVVRQEHAHAWAEALITRTPPTAAVTAIAGGPAAAVLPPRMWHWLVLDPSPDAPTSADTAGSNWLERAARQGRSLFNDYLVDYTPERREQAIRATVDAVTSTKVVIGAGVALVLVLGVWAVRRRRVSARAAPTSDPARWLGRLLMVLAAHGYVPRSGETPQEFAAGVAGALRAHPGLASVSDVAREWVAAYYRDRFGGTPVPPEQQAELEARLNELRLALGRG